MTRSEICQLQKQLRLLLASQVRPTHATDPLDPAFHIWKHAPTLAWALGTITEQMDANCPPALKRPDRNGKNRCAD